MKETLLTQEELEKDSLTQEDNEYIEKEMNDAINETLKEINDEIDNNEDFKKEVDDIFSTNDIKERVEIFKKYYPNDTRFE